MSDSPNWRLRLVSNLKQAQERDEVSKLYDRFVEVEHALIKDVYPHVVTGALKHAAETQDAWLNDHGAAHVATVLARASDLVDTDDQTLTAYETYVLLMGILFHDVGNVYGREDHERKIGQAMASLGDRFSSNSYERRLIKDIASVHGGLTDDGDRDTIASLPRRYPQPRGRPAAAGDVRPHLLAAILRFADELADDHSRAGRFLLQEGLLEGSEMYHRYSDRLQRVVPKPTEHRVEVHFDLSVRDLTRRYARGAEEGYIVDYILERLLKMRSEFLYCSRIWRPFLQYDAVAVRIVITDPAYMHELETVECHLRDTGYPADGQTLEDVCPNLAGFTGAEMSRKYGEGSANDEA